MLRAIFSKGFINSFKFLNHSENLLLLLEPRKILGLLESFSLAEGMLEVLGDSGLRQR